MVVAIRRMMIRTKTELAPMISFILLFILVVEGGEGLTPVVSSGDIFLTSLKLILKLNC